MRICIQLKQYSVGQEVLWSIPFGKRLDQTYIFSSLEFIDVDVDDLGCGEGLLQGSMVWVVFRRGLP